VTEGTITGKFTVTGEDDPTGTTDFGPGSHDSDLLTSDVSDPLFKFTADVSPGAAVPLQVDIVHDTDWPGGDGKISREALSSTDGTADFGDFTDLTNTADENFYDENDDEANLQITFSSPCLASTSVINVRFIDPTSGD